MLDFLKDMLIVIMRIATIFPLLLFITLFMGKRAIGQLPVFDFLIIISLGSVVGADIADPKVEHMPTIIAIIMLGIFQRIVSKYKISNRKFDRLITFEPTVIIQDGQFLNNNLKRIRYSIDNIIQMLREKNVFDIGEVETAIIEANGSLSVLKKPQKNTVTLEDMNIAKKSSSISFPVVIEGKIYNSVLEYFNLNETWLQQQVVNRGVTNVNDIFFASINNNQELHICLRDENNVRTPPIKHE